MRGVPLFGTLLAVERDGETQAGVVSAPALGRALVRQARRGSVDGRRVRPVMQRRIRVSAVADVAAAQMLFRRVTDMRASRARRRGWSPSSAPSGASAASATSGATRWSPTVPPRRWSRSDLGPWDLAAPWIVVEEAGGRVSDFDGRRAYDRGESLATNGMLHERLLDHLWSRAESVQIPGSR